MRILSRMCVVGIAAMWLYVIVLGVGEVCVNKTAAQVATNSMVFSATNVLFMTNMEVEAPYLRRLDQAFYGAGLAGWVIGRYGGTTNDVRLVISSMNAGNKDALDDWIKARGFGR